MNQKTFNIAREYMLEQGVPTSAGGINTAVKDITGFDVSGLIGAQGHGLTFSSTQELATAYAQYRQSHNIARYGSHIAEMSRCLYMGRQASQYGSIMFAHIFDTFSHVESWTSHVRGTVMKYPLVISEEARLNLDAGPMTDQKHVLIQVLTGEGMSSLCNNTAGSGDQQLRGLAEAPAPFTSGVTLSSMWFARDRYETAIAERVEKLTEAGWQLVKHKYLTRSALAGNVPHEIIIGAVPPKSDSRSGWFGIMLFNTNSYRYQAAALGLMLQAIHDNREEVPDEDAEKKLEALAMHSILSQAAEAVRQVDSSVQALQSTVTQRDRDLEQYRNHIASTLRVVTDERRQLHEMRRSSARVAIRTIGEMIMLPDTLKSLRQIEHCEISTAPGNGVKAQFITHPYGMRGLIGGYFDDDDDWVEGEETVDVLIPKLKITLNLTQNSFSTATKIERGDGKETDYFHPHIEYDTICWGDAATPLAEAFGRRDWESYARLICAFITQYNDESPYINIRSLRDSYLGEPPKRGWIYPEQTLEENAADQEPAAEDKEPAVAPVLANA